MASSSAVVSILEKIVSKDKDFRYMATSDLLNELQKDTFRVDSDLERKLGLALLTQLEDASGDISGLAVKCMGRLVRKVGEPRAEEMVKALCDKALTGKKDQTRDIASIALKTVIMEIPGGSLAANTAPAITTKMLDGMGSQDKLDETINALDILCELLGRFGGLVGTQHQRITTVCLAYLDDAKVPLRKRATHSLAAVAAYLSDDLLVHVVSTLLEKLKAGGGKPDVMRSYVQAVGQISRAVGYRFGRFLPDALPLMVQHCRAAAEGDDELREHCLQALEGFVQRCPSACRAHLDALLGCCLQYLRYDPNFADSMDDDGGGDDGMDDDEDDDGSEDEYSDDEDMSWKVRRAAAKCVTATLLAYPDAVAELYKRTAEPLVQRFREREENVLQDVYGAYVVLCKQVAGAARGYAPDDPTSPLALLRADVPGTLRSTTKVLRAKSPKTRVGAFGLLRELAAVLPSSVAEDAAMLVPGVLAALNDKSSGNSNLKIEALSFLRLLLVSNPPEVFRAHVSTLAPAVFANAKERYYKVSAESLRVCGALVRVLSGGGGDSGSACSCVAVAELKPLARPLFDTVFDRLNAQDQDQEVKEAVIMSMATLVATLADEVKDDVPQVLRVLLERLHNEVTRLPAVRAVGTVCASPCAAADMRPVLPQLLPELTSFLRKASRMLRSATLTALEALTVKYGTDFDGAAADACAEEAAVLITEGELPIATLSLRLLVALLLRRPALAAAVADRALAPAIALLGSALLQGSALEALKSFFAGLAASGEPRTSQAALLPPLLAAGGAPGGAKQALHSVAKCVAALCTGSEAAQVQATVSKLLEGAGSDNDVTQRLSLLCLGEIGRCCDLSSVPQVEQAITASLSSESEDTKAAASLALGGISCGNLQRYMPALIDRIAAAQASPKQQYLLLQALAEVLSSISAVGQHTMDLSEGDQQRVLALLLGACDSEEECRNIVAECLGQLALLHPQLVLTALSERTASPSANVRCVVALAVKHAVVERPHAVDAPLSSAVLSFLSLAADSDRSVRRAAVASMAAAAHHKATLVAPHLEVLLPMLYKNTVVQPELVRVVDLGPFKHTIDDGLELRKAAFECLDILLDACRPHIEAPTFMAHLEGGLQDHYDVKMPAHLLLAKLAASEPATVLAAMERLVGPLEKTLNARVKGDAVKQELDRHEHMLRSCLRAVDALEQLEGAAGCTPFRNFLTKTVKGPPAMREKYAQVQAERAEAEGGGVVVAEAMEMS